ncbi:MAG: DUF2249 domain-containing protein [Haloferacaceae archaeon]
MATTDWRTEAVDATGAPADRPVCAIDVRDDPPPGPLRRTLETLADLDDETVLVQRNDREPRHLYPNLDDRGYEWATVETEAGVLTAVWR